MFPCSSKGCNANADWYYSPFVGNPGYFCTLHTAGKNAHYLEPAGRP